MPKPPTTFDLTNLENGIARLQELFEVLNAAIESQTEKTVRSGNLRDLLVLFRTLDEGYDAIDALRKKFYLSNDTLNKSIVPQAIENSGMDLVRIPDLGRSFYIVPKLSVSIVEGAKEAAYDWLRKNGGEDLPQLTVNAGTLAAWVRQMQKEKNIDPPAELFTLNPYNTTGSSKYTPKK